jgi:phage-related protein
MGSFQAVYYRDANGKEPVAVLIASLPAKGRAALKNQMGRLNLLSDEHPHLPFPHSSHIRGDIRELRCHWGRQHFRILYARSDRLVVLLNAFRKASSRIPDSEILLAEERWNDFRVRMNAEPRRGPRAAGHDAP